MSGRRQGAGFMSVSLPCVLLVRTMDTDFEEIFRRLLRYTHGARPKYGARKLFFFWGGIPQKSFFGVIFLEEYTLPPPSIFVDKNHISNILQSFSSRFSGQKPSRARPSHKAKPREKKTKEHKESGGPTANKPQRNTKTITLKG